VRTGDGLRERAAAATEELQAAEDQPGPGPGLRHLNRLRRNVEDLQDESERAYNEVGP
jgi:hypothetical protein